MPYLSPPADVLSTSGDAGNPSPLVEHVDAPVVSTDEIAGTELVRLSDETLSVEDDDLGRRYPRRARRPVDRYGWTARILYPISAYVSYGDLSPTFRAYSMALSDTSVPRSVSEAMREPQWVLAMQTEMDALQRNHTWDLVPLPSGVKPVGCR